MIGRVGAIRQPSPRGGRLLGNGVEERDCVGVGVSRNGTGSHGCSTFDGLGH
jgi:hypothetical protein